MFHILSTSTSTSIHLIIFLRMSKLWSWRSLEMFFKRRIHVSKASTQQWFYRISYALQTLPVGAVGVKIQVAWWCDSGWCVWRGECVMIKQICNEGMFYLPAPTDPTAIIHNLKTYLWRYPASQPQGMPAPATVFADKISRATFPPAHITF